jgi:thiol:disulfide interchange protein
VERLGRDKNNEHRFVVVAVTNINLALRGLMELGIIVALAYWGLQTGASTIVKIVLGIGAPLLVFGFWGAYDFHDAGRWAEPLRLLQELVICGLAAVLLYVVGQPTLAWAVALISIVHHVLVYVLGGSLLRS